MQIDIFTLFPQMFDGPLTESILKRAQEHGLLAISRHDIRNWTTDKHRTADDTPYGGGGGMIMKPQPILASVEEVLGDELGKIPVILTTPQGKVFNQQMAKELSAYPRLAFICGRYEGIDERVRDLVVTHEISIGDFVLTGGELPVMVMIDAIARYLPGVLGEEGAADDDSHATGLLEHPYYTRPPEFRGLTVPPELLTGSHRVIERWRRDQAIRRTWQRRPDLLLTAELTDQEKYSLADLALAWLKDRS
jgi:tRNA (guanine37-N1)-methyltransferase